MSEVKIKLFSPYHHFPNHVPKDGEKYIECYNDAFAKRKPENPEKAIALLIEPRPLQLHVYEHIEEHYNDFKYVFTHDSILLNKLPNAKLIIWGGVWSWGDQEKDFSHPISMVASWKEEAPTRIARKHLAMELKNNPRVVCYGTFDGGEFVDTDTIYGKYPFSIVIENYIDDYWITEKICNCFSHKTVPIYYGAKKIDELFNGKGIIHCDSVENILYILNYIKEGSYKNRITYIEDNYQRVKKYEKFETWFFNEYGELLRGMQND